MKLTRRQRTALDHPCLLPEETIHSRFIWADWKRRCSTILTLNSGFE